MDWSKVVTKGIEGAVVGASGCAATIAVSDAALDEVEKSLAVVLSALAGFLIRAVRNWIKHRKTNGV